MNKAMSCRVKRGDVSSEDAVALEMALDDLRVYWEKAFGVGSFLLGNEQPECEADLNLLIGTPENLPEIAALEAGGLIEKLQIPEQGFALDILERKGKRTAVLRAGDRLGLQYAVYGFAEQFLGVRFVHPLLDLQPETPPLPKELQLVENHRSRCGFCSTPRTCASAAGVPNGRHPTSATRSRGAGRTGLVIRSSC